MGTRSGLMGPQPASDQKLWVDPSPSRKFSLTCGGSFVRVSLAVPCPEVFAFVCLVSHRQPIEACSCYFDAQHLPSIRLLRSTFQPITLMLLSGVVTWEEVIGAQAAA